MQSNKFYREGIVNHIKETRFCAKLQTTTLGRNTLASLALGATLLFVPGIFLNRQSTMIVVGSTSGYFSNEVDGCEYRSLSSKQSLFEGCRLMRGC